MSTIIKFELKDLKKLTIDKNSCVVEKRVKQKLALQPWCLGNLKESIKNLLDYKIGKFDKEHNGILLSYKNLRVLQNVGNIRNDCAEVHFDIQADYFIFQPYVGATLRGIVNKKSITHLGILVHRVFNVVIPRPTEEPGGKWIGTNVQEGQEVIFRIVVLDLFGALPYIRGELDERSLIGPNGDEELESRQLEPLNTSYVNFEKTKPAAHKQMSDGVPQESLKTSQKNDKLNASIKPHKKNFPSDSKCTNSPKVKVAESYSSVKTKRPTKLQQGDPSDSTPKLSKKNKKEE